MSGVAVTVVQVVGVIPVRHGDVAAPLTVLVVVGPMGGVTGSGALVDMVTVDPVDVAVMRVIGVVAVREGDVTATLTVGVRVPFVRAVVGGGGHGGTPRLPFRLPADLPRTTHCDINIWRLLHEWQRHHPRFTSRSPQLH
jgi:hypothetical protein